MSETEYIEAYLNKGLSPEEHLFMEAKLLIDSRLQNHVLWQQTTYQLIKEHGRKSLKKDIETAQNRVFTEKRFSPFQSLIYHLFKSS